MATTNNDTNAPTTPTNEDDIIAKKTAMDELNIFLKDFNDFKVTFQKFHKRGKDIKKMFEREIKELKKNRKTKRTRKPDAKPGGFRKPTKITDQLCQFLGFEKGTLHARTEVSKKLNEWIRDQGLQNPKDRRIIIPNKQLLDLFNDDYVDGCHLDFFTMQKYIRHHYIKDIPVTPEKK